MDHLFSNDKPIQSTFSNGITNTNQLLYHVSNIIDKPNQLRSKTQYAVQRSTYEDIMLEKQFNDSNVSIQSKPINVNPMNSSSYINANETIIQKDNYPLLNNAPYLMNQHGINPIPRSLIEFNEQLKNETLKDSENKENGNENNNQSALKDIIDIMEKQKDERMTNSSFLSLMKSLEKGEKTINEDKNTIDNVNKLNDDDIKLNNLWNKISKEVELIPSSILPQEYYSTALKCLEEGNTPQALALLQADSINNPENAEGYYLQAKIHMDNGRDDLAIACSNKALSIDYFHLPSYLTLATCYSNEGDESQAIEQIIKWLKLNTQFNTYYDKANPLLNIDILNNNDDDGHQASVKYSIENNASLTELIYKELALILEKISNGPNITNMNDVLLSLGICHMTLMNYDKAQEVFENLTQINPHDYTAWNRLGATLNNNKQQGKAIEMYTKALAIKQNYSRCLTNMGIAYMSLDENVLSAQYFIKALNAYRDNNDVWNYLTSVFLSMGRDDYQNASMKRDLNTLNSIISVL